MKRLEKIRARREMVRRTGKLWYTHEYDPKWILSDAYSDISWLLDKLEEAHRMLYYSGCAECGGPFRSYEGDCIEAHHLDVRGWLAEFEK